jgi:PPOX class probable F420-dependent enzyme
MPIPDSIRELVDKGPHAHLTTLNKDGSPQTSVVWVGIEHDEFVMGHMGVWQKVRNVRRDPRVCLSFLSDTKTPMGILEYVAVHGQARVTEGGGAELLQRLAPLYLGPGAVFPPESHRNRPSYITRVTPSRFTGVGPWSPR